MHMLSVSKIALAGAVAIVAVVGAGSAVAQDVVRVGTLNSMPIGGNNPPTGFCVDLMNAIAEKTGLQFEFSFLAVADMWPGAAGPGALVAGSVDVICGTAGANRRSADISLTSAIYGSPEGIIVAANNPATYTSVADLRALPAGAVGAIAGSASVAYLNNVGVAGFRTYPSLDALGQALTAGEVQAVLFFSDLFNYQKNVLGMWPNARLVTPYQPSFPSYNTLAVRSGDAELLGTLQAATEALKADGTLTTLLTRWGVTPPPF